MCFHGLMRSKQCRLQQTSSDKKRQTGYTIVEVVVGIVAVAVLLAVLLPSVVRARAKARNVACHEKLRKIGTALEMFIAADRAFPTAHLTDENSGVTLDFQMRMLPAVSAEAVLKRLLQRDKAGGSLRVPVYLCPEDSDAYDAASQTFTANYHTNIGLGFAAYQPYSGFRQGNSVDSRQEDFSDGLSTTFAISERLSIPPGIKGGLTGTNALRFFWWTEKRFYGKDEVEAAVDQARFHRTSPDPQSSVGYSRDYDHLLPPNHPASANGPNEDGADTEHRLIPPNSLHGNFVNSLMADGSSRTTSNNVALKIWRAFGTRAGDD